MPALTQGEHLCRYRPTDTRTCYVLLKLSHFTERDAGARRGYKRKLRPSTRMWRRWPSRYSHQFPQNHTEPGMAVSRIWMRLCKSPSRLSRHAPDYPQHTAPSPEAAVLPKPHVSTMCSCPSVPKPRAGLPAARHHRADPSHIQQELSFDSRGADPVKALKLNCFP